MLSNYRSSQNVAQAFTAQRPYAAPYKKRTRFIDTVAADDGTDDGILSVVENPDCSSADLPCNVETPDGKRVIEIPVFDSMTKFMMSPQGMNQRLPLYTYLNEQLRKGRLSRIVGFPVLNRVINRAACEFTSFSYWEITRYEFITDISVKLTLESYDGIHEWNGVLVCFCGFSHQFYLIAEELTASTKEEREGFTPLDSHLIQVYKGAQIDLEAERMWVKYKLPEALTNPKMRKARRLAEKMGLTVLRLPIYEHKGLNSILFFEEGTLLVGADRVVKDEDGHEVIIKDDHGEPVTIPANTIVVNSNRIAEEYEDFPIFHECYHYEKHYLAFRLQKLTCSDNRKIKKKKIVVQQGVTQKDYLFFMENHADRAAHGLMMPATDTRNRIQALLSQVKNYRHDGELFEFVGMTVSTQLDMPHFRMRARMIQLGYPQAKGILHYVEQRRIRPFAFDLDSLYAEELTFVITPAKIKKLCDESDAFRKVVHSRRFVYAEGHMVFNDPRFVEVQGGIYKLTNYAIANVDVCCLRFVNIYVQKNLGQYVLGRMYMDAEYVERTLFYLNDLLKNPDMNDFRAKKAYKESFPTDFKDAVEMLKAQNGGVTNAVLSEALHMTEPTFQRALSDPKKYKNEDFVMALSLYFKLPDWISELLFKRAHVYLDSDDERHAAMIEIQRSRSCDGIEAAQEFMKMRGVEPLNWA